MASNDPNDAYSKVETERRFKATLKTMLSTPPKPHSESAPKRKRKAAKKSRPAKRK
jgi:hypothetical protein